MSIQIYGKNPVLEVLQSTRKIYRVYVMENSHPTLVASFKRQHIPVETMSKHDFKKRFLGNHQGIAADVEDYKTWSLDAFLNDLDVTKNPLVLMLDGITDPHNFGAIIRTAEAGGVAGIIIPKHRSAHITAAVVKVSSGAIEHVKIIEVTNLRQTIDALKERGFWAVGTDLKAEKSHHEIRVDVPLLLVIGSEGKGMSKIVSDHVDYSVKIDMVGSINSLNASVSAGILIFEILRKKS